MLNDPGDGQPGRRNGYASGRLHRLAVLAADPKHGVLLRISLRLDLHGGVVNLPQNRGGMRYEE